MKSFAVTVLLDAEDERAAVEAVSNHLNDAVALQHIEVVNIEEVPE